MHNAPKGLAPLLGGGLLAAAGLRRGSVLGLLAAAAGGWLAYRGYRMARCTAGEAGCTADKAKCRVLLDTLGAGVTTGIYDHTAQHAKEERTHSDDPADDASLEAMDDSFPCSDPPSFSPRKEDGAIV
jgi:hypothetical protein